MSDNGEPCKSSTETGQRSVGNDDDRVLKLAKKSHDDQSKNSDGREVEVMKRKVRDRRHGYDIS